MSRPRKLKKDSIQEALFEIQFDCAEQVIPELAVSTLASNAPWSKWRAERTSEADLPMRVRVESPIFKYKPFVVFRSQEDDRRARVGPNVLSYHVAYSYPGWEVFREELQRVLDKVFDEIEGASIVRLGLRYINALNPEDHMIGGVEDTTLNLKVNEKPLLGAFNLMNSFECEKGISALVRVVSPVLVSGVAENTSLLIDIDMLSQEEALPNTKDEVLSWLDLAHNHEKDIFFGFWPRALLKEVVENWEDN